MNKTPLQEFAENCLEIEQITKRSLTSEDIQRMSQLQIRQKELLPIVLWKMGIDPADMDYLRS